MHARFALAFGRGAHRQELRENGLGAGLTIRADWPEMLLLADERTPVMTGRGLAMIGQIFSAEHERMETLDDVPGGPSSLMPPGWWGNFAVFSAQEGAPAQVYRDPSGSIPVYHLAGPDADLFVSDAALAAELGLTKSAAIDPAFAVHWLQFPYLRTCRTGLANVHEVLPGILRTKTGGAWLDELIWDPWDYAAGKDSLFDTGAAAAALRSTALHAVAAQVGQTPVLLQLSGGVDSSILAACLHHADIPFSAVTFATRSTDGDERGYARLVAEAFGIRLWEIGEDELPCVLEPPAGPTFRPGSNPVLLPLDKAVEQQRRELGAPLLVDGGGGDNLFCYLTNAAPVLDAFLGAGPRAGLAALRDIAERADCTLWQVGMAALRRASPTGVRRWKVDRRFLNPEALLPGPDRHPWLSARRFAFPGKGEHVSSLVQIQHFLDRRVAPGTTAFHPLMGQPLLELCLKIPTWLWVGGGVDRAIAREAFKDLLPPAIMERRSKGSLQGLFHRFFGRQYHDLRDLLLSGELRELKILDTPAVEQAFAGGMWVDDEAQMRLSEMASLEFWLQSWRR